MDITDEMIERAASALYDYDHERAGTEPPPIPLLALPYPAIIGIYKGRARAALEAALGIHEKNEGGR